MAGRWLASITVMYAASRALSSRLSKASASASAAPLASSFVPPTGCLSRPRRRHRPCPPAGSVLLVYTQHHQSLPYATASSVTQRASSTFDELGRRVRNRSNDENGGGGGDNDDESWRVNSNRSSSREKDRWADFSDREDKPEASWTSFRKAPRGSSSNDYRGGTAWGREQRPSRGGGGSSTAASRGRDRGTWRSGGPGYDGARGGRERSGRPRASSSDPGALGGERKINMNALEGAGFVHLYGLAPVLNALQASRRDLSDPDVLAGKFDSAVRAAEDEEENDDEIGAPRTARDGRKPEAQFRPWLFLQEKARSGRGSDKALQEQAILKLAKERNVPVATVDKGVLNALSGNRPHQGVCLRCGRLDFTPISRIPVPDAASDARPPLWLVLDEVVDPQNFGALLRSAYFLGGTSHVRILVCGKNSAPPSPVVSAASAGALEIVPVFSTNNLPRTLAAAEEDGFAILGASSKVRDLDTPVYDLQDLPLDFVDKQPTVLLLGSEGSGLRHLVATSCTHFVRIPPGRRGDGDDVSSAIAGVDSLNVSVTGGILLWRLLAGCAGR